MAVVLGVFHLFLLAPALLHLSLADVCYLHTCQGVGCLQTDIANGNVQTCTQGVNGCQTILTSAGDIALCLSDDSCIPSFHHSNGTEQTTLCCKGDRCNDGTLPVRDTSKTQCYAITCDYEGCLTELLSKAVLCDKDPRFDCTMSISGSSESGQQVHYETADCGRENPVTSECISVAHKTPTSFASQSCCDQSLCNDGNIIIPDGDNYCYAMSCVGMTDDCLQSSVAQGKVPACRMNPEYGCYLQTYAVSGQVTVSAGCATAEMTCTPMSMTNGSQSSRVECCSSRLCNDQVSSNNQGQTNVNKCYAYQCLREGSDACLSESIAASAGRCSRSSLGCQYSVSHQGQSSYKSASCVSPEQPCQSLAAYQNESLWTVTKCCSGDICNEEPRIDRSKNQCYDLQCIGENCFERAISKNVFNLCDMSSYGCEVLRGNLTDQETGQITYGLVYRCADSPCTVGETKAPYQFVVTKCCQNAMCCEGATCGCKGITTSTLAVILLTLLSTILS